MSWRNVLHYWLFVRRIYWWSQLNRSYATSYQNWKKSTCRLWYFHLHCSWEQNTKQHNTTQHNTTSHKIQPHWDLSRMADILQTAISIVFIWTVIHPPRIPQTRDDAMTTMKTTVWFLRNFYVQMPNNWAKIIGRQRLFHISRLDLSGWISISVKWGLDPITEEKKT